MKRIITLSLVLVTSFAFSQSAKEIAKKCMSSTVSLVMEDNYKQPVSLGSGFIVENGKIVTNLHVIEGAKYGSVFINGSSTKHKIEGYYAIDKKNDLAILSVPSLYGMPLSLGNAATPEVGEKVYAIGNPKGLSGTISEGIVSGIRNLEGQSLIQITAPISPGSSGGPVINNNGNVVGVAVGTLTSGQNLNFAIPSSAITALLNNQNSTITPLNIAKGVTAPKTSKNERAVKDGVHITNVEWEAIYRTISSAKLKRPDEYDLKGFSITNDLPYEIKNIKVRFILKDRSGRPIDYLDKEYFASRYSDGLKPYLAKYYETSFINDYRGRVMERRYGEELEIRILDFEIIED